MSGNAPGADPLEFAGRAISRRLFSAAVVVLITSLSLPISVGVVNLVDPAGASAVELAGAVPDDAGHSIGSPDAGPRPQNPGDRGGWAQLSLLGLLIVAVSFIMWRIFHEARGGRPVSRN